MTSTSSGRTPMRPSWRSRLPPTSQPPSAASIGPNPVSTSTFVSPGQKKQPRGRRNLLVIDLQGVVGRGRLVRRAHHRLAHEQEAVGERDQLAPADVDALDRGSRDGVLGESVPIEGRAWARPRRRLGLVILRFRVLAHAGASLPVRPSSGADRRAYCRVTGRGRTVGRVPRSRSWRCCNRPTRTRRGARRRAGVRVRRGHAPAEVAEAEREEQRREADDHRVDDVQVHVRGRR